MSNREFELKLQIPAHALPAVRQRVVTSSAVRTRLQAVYFDTPEGRLECSGLALRLRREGAHWVQTLKAAVPGQPLDRLEHNVVRRGSAEPPLDVSLHDQTPAGERLRAAMADSALEERFRTDIQRTHRLHRLKGGSVELALDEGAIISGGHRWTLCELEIELVNGPPALVLDTAAQWIEREGLWIDTRTKAERGHRLWQARMGQSVDPQDSKIGPARSASSMLDPDESTHRRAGLQTLNLQQAFLQPLLAPLLANASDLADATGSDEHIHQLRVSVRRLRSVLRLADRWSPTWPESVMDAILKVFRQLGAQRDVKVIEAEFGAALRGAGCPLTQLPRSLTETEEPHVLKTLRSPEVNLAWIWLLRQVHEPQPDVHVDAVSALVNQRLERWSLEIDQLGKRFARLEEPAQHELRKRIKRLRYGLDSCAALGLWSIRQPRREYVEALAGAQATLGNYCDLLTARDLWRHACQLDPQAWFAVGWISAELGRLQPTVVKMLKRLAKIEKRWRTVDIATSSA